VPHCCLGTVIDGFQPMAHVAVADADGRVSATVGIKRLVLQLQLMSGSSLPSLSPIWKGVISSMY